MIKSVYLDTSVIGGYFDDEFKDLTRPFFERILSEKIEIIQSDLLEYELIGGPLMSASY